MVKRNSTHAVTQLDAVQHTTRLVRYKEMAVSGQPRTIRMHKKQKQYEWAENVLIDEERMK